MDYGDGYLFVTDQRGFPCILDGMIDDLQNYIEKSNGASGIHLN